MVLAERKREEQFRSATARVELDNTRRKSAANAPDDEKQEVSVHTKRRLRVGRFLFTVACVFVLGFILVSGQLRVAALGYEVSSLRDQIEEVRAENEYLKVKKAQLMTPSRVEAAARNQGMTYASDRRFVQLRPEVLLAQAQVQPEPKSAVVSLVGPGSASVVRASGSHSPQSLQGVSQWFFQWLTGVRTAEAGSIR